MARQIAVILYNLGGPDRLESVRPFLFNLFYDPAIFSVPNPLRWLLAQLVSRRRTKTAQEIYSLMGGKSPILDETNAQAEALKSLLAERLGSDIETHIYVAMRYWHPFAEQALADIVTKGINEVFLLSLYPQFSGTTTGSFLTHWEQLVRRSGVSLKAKSVCCYPIEANFISAHQALLCSALAQLAEQGGAVDTPRYRVLFSAHGLPQRCVDRGDPYERHVNLTARAIMAGLDPEIDWRICYQSKVGPLEWLKPSTEEALEQAGKEKKNVILVPIAFVSEHSETKVELDIEYAHRAHELGISCYIRVPTLSTHTLYIESLARQVVGLLNQEQESISDGVSVWRACDACGAGTMGVCQNRAPLLPEENDFGDGKVELEVQ